MKIYVKIEWSRFAKFALDFLHISSTLMFYNNMIHYGGSSRVKNVVALWHLMKAVDAYVVRKKTCYAFLSCWGDKEMGRVILSFLYTPSEAPTFQVIDFMNMRYETTHNVVTGEEILEKIWPRWRFAKAVKRLRRARAPPITLDQASLMMSKLYAKTEMLPERRKRNLDLLNECLTAQTDRL